MSSRPHSSAAHRSRRDTAALFVDYDNLHTILRAQSARGAAPGSYATEILDEVRRYLEEGDDTPTIFGRAYADYASLPEADDVQRALHHRGVNPVFTPGEAQANAAEVQLSLDVSRLLAERPDLQTFVIVTGDRPYLPLVRRVREQGRRPLVAAVNPPQSEALSRYAEDDAFLDARNLLSQSSRDDLLANAPADDRARGRSDASPPPRRYRSLDNPVARRTIEITEEHFGQYEEVYLTPLLRKLSDILGDQHDPKSLVSELEAAGAVRLEKRDGYPYDYTVLIVNEDHPDVEEIQRRRRRSSGTGNGRSRAASRSASPSRQPRSDDASAEAVGGGLDQSHGREAEGASAVDGEAPAGEDAGDGPDDAGDDALDDGDWDDWDDEASAP
jgi:hypothetical protein